MIRIIVIIFTFPRQQIMFYISTGYSLMNNSEKAFEYLKQAMDNGFSSYMYFGI
jgi:phosphosulfolactate synthase (CoM biosynthesis protein A)